MSHRQATRSLPLWKRLRRHAPWQRPPAGPIYMGPLQPIRFPEFPANIPLPKGGPITLPWPSYIEATVVGSAPEPTVSCIDDDVTDCTPTPVTDSLIVKTLPNVRTNRRLAPRVADRRYESSWKAVRCNVFTADANGIVAKAKNPWV